MGLFYAIVGFKKKIVTDCYFHAIKQDMCYKKLDLRQNTTRIALEDQEL